MENAEKGTLPWASMTEPDQVAATLGLTDYKSVEKKTVRDLCMVACAMIGFGYPLSEAFAKNQCPPLHIGKSKKKPFYVKQICKALSISMPEGYGVSSTSKKRARDQASSTERLTAKAAKLDPRQDAYEDDEARPRAAANLIAPKIMDIIKAKAAEDEGAEDNGGGKPPAS